MEGPCTFDLGEVSYEKNSVSVCWGNKGNNSDFVVHGSWNSTYSKNSSKFVSKENDSISLLHAAALQHIIMYILNVVFESNNQMVNNEHLDPKDNDKISFYILKKQKTNKTL
jgi:hypothetical protein